LILSLQNFENASVMKSRKIVVERGKGDMPNAPTDLQIAPRAVLLYQTLTKPVAKEFLVSSKINVVVVDLGLWYKMLCNPRIQNSG
jgi:hypothetical protein